MLAPCTKVALVGALDSIRWKMDQGQPIEAGVFILKTIEKTLKL